MRKVLRLHFVYAICAPGSLEPIYIGCGSGRRDTSHFAKCFNPELRALIKEHGRLPVVRIREQMTKNEAYELEALLIKAFGRAQLGCGPLLNRSDGGIGPRGIVRTDAFRAKISATHKGRIFTAEQRETLSAAMKGKVKSPEHRKNLSAAHKGKVRSPAHCAALSAGWAARRARLAAEAAIPASRKRLGSRARPGQAQSPRPAP